MAATARGFGGARLSGFKPRDTPRNERPLMPGEKAALTEAMFPLPACCPCCAVRIASAGRLAGGGRHVRHSARRISTRPRGQPQRPRRYARAGRRQRGWGSLCPMRRCAVAKGLQLVSLSPTMPARMQAMQASRKAETGSAKRTMPSSAVPTEPMPVQMT